MSKGETRRKTIFEKYSNQLKLLDAEGLLPERIKLPFDNTYICPLCLNPFSEDTLDQSKSNPLTLEDAPQKALGGKAATLTCKECNNKCGEKIDNHLTSGLIERDQRDFLPNTSGKAKFEIDNVIVQGSYTVDENRNITVVNNESNNNPSKLEQYRKGLKKGRVTVLSFKKTKVDERRLLAALLKTAYILAFEKYGYIFILDECYDIVRKQLENPEVMHYPDGFWTKKDFEEKDECVYYISSQKYKGMYSVFALKTAVTTKRFGVYLPIPDVDYHKIIRNLKKMEKGGSMNINCFDKADLLSDIEAIRYFHNLISVEKNGKEESS